MEYTNNLKLPLLVPNQSGKEFTHNEALIIIDNLMHNGIDNILSVPPISPVNNSKYIVDKNAAGDFSGKDDQIAIYDNGWRFIIPFVGQLVWNIASSKLYAFNNNWSEVIVDNKDSRFNISVPKEGDILAYDGFNFTNLSSKLTNNGISIDNQTVDLNGYIESGLYFFNDCLIGGLPDNLTSNYLWLQVYKEKNDYCLQTIKDRNGNYFYNRVGYIGNWSEWRSTSCYSMPSNRYIDLTISVGIDTVFIAPANGYYSARTGNVPGFIQILKFLNGTNNVLFSSSIFSNAVYNSVNIPVSKGENVIITVSGSVDFCRFVYLNDN